MQHSGILQRHGRPDTSDRHREGQCSTRRHKCRKSIGISELQTSGRLVDPDFSSLARADEHIRPGVAVDIENTYFIRSVRHPRLLTALFLHRDVRQISQIAIDVQASPATGDIDVHVRDDRIRMAVLVQVGNMVVSAEAVITAEGKLNEVGQVVRTVSLVEHVEILPVVGNDDVLLAVLV